MTEIDLSRAQWFKSSYSGQSGNCVEVARNLLGMVAVRDSEEPAGAQLVISRDAWRSFMSTVRALQCSSKLVHKSSGGVYRRLVMSPELDHVNRSLDGLPKDAIGKVVLDATRVVRTVFIQHAEADESTEFTNHIPCPISLRVKPPPTPLLVRDETVNIRFAAGHPCNRRAPTPAASRPRTPELLARVGRQHHESDLKAICRCCVEQSSRRSSGRPATPSPTRAQGTVPCKRCADNETSVQPCSRPDSLFM